jgi:glucose/mannose transport system permease protein
MASVAVGYDPFATSSSWRRNRAKVGVYILLSIFAAWYLLPLVVVILNSFRPLPEIAANGLIGFPQSLQLEAWARAWGTYCIGGTCAGVAPNFFNSLWMAIPATIISTSIGCINGYILSKWRFRGSEWIFGAMTLGVFLPGQMVLLPWAHVLGNNGLGLTNTIAGLILIHTVQGLAFTTLFCRNYYVSIPDDLIKAARIDGAGFWRIFRRIVLPLSPPILIVTVIWQFTGIWNDFLFAVVFSSGRNQPITAAIIALGTAGQNVREFDVTSAAVLIGALPPLLVYLFGGRYFISGLTQGAIK